MASGGFTVDFDLDEDALDELLDDEGDDLLQNVGDELAATAAGNAPKLTGAGAASIQALVHDEGGERVVDVSWDDAHFYMKFAETGTEHETARPFLRPALDSARI